MYADDLKIYDSGLSWNINDAVLRVNHELKRFFDWGIANDHSLNAKKSMDIIISGRGILNDTSHVHSILVNGQAILFHDSVVNLGLTIDGLPM